MSDSKTKDDCRTGFVLYFIFLLKKTSLTALSLTAFSMTLVDSVGATPCIIRNVPRLSNLKDLKLYG